MIRRLKRATKNRPDRHYTRQHGWMRALWKARREGFSR